MFYDNKKNNPPPYLKLNIWLSSHFQTCVNRHLSWQDKLAMAQVVHELFLRYLKKTDFHHIPNQLSKKISQQLQQRLLKFFPSPLNSNYFQELLFKLSLQSPEHPFVPSLNRLSDIQYELDPLGCFLLHDIPEKKFTAISHNAESITSAIFHFQKIDDQLIQSLAQLRNLQSLSLTELYGNYCSDGIIELIGKKIKKLNTLYLKCLNSENEIQGNTLDALPKTLTSLTINNSSILPDNLEKLQNYSNLTELNLSSNPSLCNSTFFATLPKNISVLRLSNCGLKDRTLQQFSTLTHLIELDLSYNGLKSGKTLAQLPKSLVKLNLSNNNLTDSIYEQLAEHKEITYLNLSNTRISGKDIEFLPKSIEALQLAGCRVSLDTYQQLEQFPHLSHLEMDYQDSALNLLPITLKVLELYTPHLTIDMCAQLQKLSNLIKFKLDYSETCTNEALALLPKSLQKIDMINSEINDIGLEFISNFPKLTHLNLSFNKEITINGISKLPASITSLRLDGCINIGDDIFTILHHLPHITSLSIASNPIITGKNIRLLPTTINELIIDRSNLSLEAISYLEHSPYLTNLQFRSKRNCFVLI